MDAIVAGIEVTTRHQLISHGFVQVLVDAVSGVMGAVNVTTKNLKGREGVSRGKDRETWSRGRGKRNSGNAEKNTYLP